MIREFVCVFCAFDMVKLHFLSVYPTFFKGKNFVFEKSLHVIMLLLLILLLIFLSKKNSQVGGVERVVFLS